MTLNAQDRHWHDVFDTLPEKEQRDISEAFDEAVLTLRQGGFICRMDDRCATLIAAITRYVVECKEDA